MLEKLKNALSSKKLVCSSCGNEIIEGQRFTAMMTLPSEKVMPVSRLDNAIARTAYRVLCDKCA